MLMRLPGSLRMRIVVLVALAIVPAAILAVDLIAGQQGSGGAAGGDHSVRWRDFAGLGALLVILGAVWVGVGALVMRPIGRLIDATRRVAAGDLDAGVGLAHDRGELGQLARAFDAMVAAMRQRHVESVAAESVLREAEERYRKLVELSPDAIYIFVDMTIVFANEAAAQLFAAPSTAFMIGRPLLDVIDPGHHDMVRRRVARMIATGAPAPKIEQTYLREDGRPVHVEVQSTPFHQYGGGIAIQVWARDITERRRAEEELRRFRTAVDTSGDAIYLIDRHTLSIIDANRVAHEMLGYRREELLAINTVDLFANIDRDELLANYRQIFEAPRQAHMFEAWKRRKDGSVFPVEVHGRAFPSASGDLIVGIARDVSERKRAESALRLNERAMQFTINGISIADADAPDMPLIYVNPAFERITGYSAAQALGRNCRFLQGEDNDQEGLAQIRAAIRGQHEAHVVLRNYRQDGTLFWNELHVAPVRNEHGRVTHYLGVQSDISERKRQEEELAFRASHDALTRLPNRTLMMDRIGQAISRAQRQGHMVGVLYLDLDRFKLFNDSIGHGAGDIVLKTVAARLSHTLRDGDTVARLGGDEFAIICGDVASENDLLPVLERIFERMREPISVEGQDLVAGTSIGVALFPRDGASGAELLKNADIAMYRAKEGGRGTFQYFTVEMNRQIEDRVSIEGQLRRALERQEFVLHFQSQRDARSGLICGTEALIRWNHPERGLIAPGQFIRVAEECGLIVPIGEWVLHEACRQNRAWQDAGLAAVPVAVNVSIAQFKRRDFVDAVRRTLAETGLEPRYLEIELTETLAMESAEHFIQALERLKQIGIKISLDDFGTGYSSLNYLKRFPIDKLKIDKSFVRDITSDPDDAAICRSIIALAHNLRLRVVAEGVEAPAQAAFLTRHHCDELQGFLFCEPAPAQTITTHLRDHVPLAAGAALDPTLDTVLLVDDDEDDIAILAWCLRGEGYQVLSASTAALALDLLATREIGVIICDQRMPLSTGSEFLSQVKALYPDTVHILISGLTDVDNISDAINQGAVYKFMTKPPDEAIMRQYVADAMHARARLRELRDAHSSG